MTRDTPTGYLTNHMGVTKDVSNLTRGTRTSLNGPDSHKSGPFASDLRRLGLRVREAVTTLALAAASAPATRLGVVARVSGRQ